MLKKHNKLIMLLVLVTFMFSIVGSAGAAAFSDVSGTDVEAAAIYRLNGLGIVNGYPDGTFGPEKTITRAEFAKIACISAGLKDVASGMGGTASTFSDVATDHWANGWINVAAAQGFVKGDPAGTFRPEDKITQAEVVTVLLRLLGYNDNLPGEWPSDYVAKAANLGILDDVTFVANQAATRGMVAVVTSATLDENIVDYVASDNIFTKKSYTLLQDSFESTATEDEVLVYGLDLSDGEQAIQVIDPKLNPNDSDDTDKIQKAIARGDFTTYTLDENCVISGAASILDVDGRFVKYTLNDDDEVVFIEVKEDADFKVIKGIDPEDIKKVDNNTIKIENGKSYDVASTFDRFSSSIPGVIYTSESFTEGKADYTRVAGSGFLSDNSKDFGFAYYASGGKITSYQGAKGGAYLDDYLEGVGLAVESVSLVLNDDDEIAYVKLNVWPTAPNPTLATTKNVGIVDSVNTKTGKVSLKSGGSFELDEDDDDLQYIVRNGKVAKLGDLAENDMVWYLDKYNTDFVVAMSVTVTGNFDSYTDTSLLGSDYVDKVDVGDKTYNVIKGGGFYSDDDGDNYDPITSGGVIDTDIDDATGGDVTLYLSPSMTVAAIMIGEGGSSSSIYGVVNDNIVTSVVNGKITDSVELALPDGTYATYAPDEDSQIKDGTNATRDMVIKGSSTDIRKLEVGQLVQVTLNSDGYIDVLKINDAIKNYEDFGGSEDTVTGDEDELTVTIGGNSYDAAKAVFFNTGAQLADPKEDDPVETVNADDFLDNADSKDGVKSITKLVGVVKDGELKYLVFKNKDVFGSTNELAMVAGKGTNSDGTYVKLLTTGDAVKYTAKSGYDATYFKKGQVVYYDLSGGDVKIKKIESKDFDCFAQPATIEKVSGNIFKVTPKNGTAKNFSVNKDTLYFDFTDDDPVVSVKGDFATGDYVRIYKEATEDSLGAVVLIEKSEYDKL